ncbi:hypothetical protein [Reinekea blandensis]|uniref:Uncharacterized protein n=1 Tax=Reinekea blandensis MED297 TaxID=314283 RepID=A4BDL3_9GAMM|nr:hypothetical protein [Reinekea blandensis]EAR09957.1 hypothetical protein MED297_06394 [Reinekea sp. MED297] [Reinekea blandensis MED297]
MTIGKGGFALARSDKTITLRVFNAVCSLFLLGAIAYALFISMNLIVITIITASVVAVATPVVLAGEGVLDVLLGILEVLIEGFVELIAGIVNSITSLFG